MTSIIIDQEFKALIPPLSAEEYAQLEANILAEGCRDALVVWAIPPSEKCAHCGSDYHRAEKKTLVYSQNEYSENRWFEDGYEDQSIWICDQGEIECDEVESFFILIDGHNRYEICQKHDRRFSCSEVKLASRQDAINWIINNQLGRRNLHPDQASYLRGKRYNGEKQQQGGTGANQHVQSSQNDNSAKTHERLAEEYKVSPATIARDGQFAAAVDTLASVGIDPQAVIAHANKADVIELAKELKKPEPEPQPKPSLFQEPIAAKQNPAPPPVVRQAVQAIKSGAAPVKETIKETVKEIKTVKQQTIVEPVITRYITLDDWAKLTAEEQRQSLQEIQSNKTFNRQEKDNEESIGNIEWAKWSWNPVSGCKHDCPYCYARDIASRFYDQGFVPTLYPDRLNAPRNTRVPSAANSDISLKNVFTCSMADLFGRWVPSEWIEAVLKQVRDNPQWNFLFLTKFPKRLSEFKFPNNAWLGTTVDCQERVKVAEDAFRKMREENSGGVWWLSLEPLIEPLQFSSLDMFDWVVIGGASQSTKTPEWHPPRAWVNALEQQAIEAACKIYEKTNLLSRIRQYPGLSEAEITKAPAAFHYLGNKP